MTDICRDKKDNFILDIAESSNSDYIITGDNDLLVLNTYKNIRIIRYEDFIEIIKEH